MGAGRAGQHGRAVLRAAAVAAHRRGPGGAVGEAIGDLFPLLRKGETTRSVQGELREVVSSHYEVFRGAERRAWECLLVPAQVAANERSAALEQLRAFDFIACRDKRFGDARDKDVACFDREEWPEFVGSGLAGKVLAGETTYYKKTIPPDARTHYETLLQHARSEILRRLADQTKATWELLDHFHRELWALKQATGKLRFGEVTHTVVDALERKALHAEELAFRLDGAIDHLLLDEFQDTSLAQWRVLHPIAISVTQTAVERQGTFFCVGDVKQAIYGWRGGMVEILNTLQASLGQLQESLLVESRRSAQPIIDAVNQVFGNLTQVQAGEKCRDGRRRKRA